MKTQEPPELQEETQELWRGGASGLPAQYLTGAALDFVGPALYSTGVAV